MEDTFPHFIQIHTLHSYPAVLLNRDSDGLAKRLPFGGATRTRISSQCLKRHWRIAQGEWALKSLGIPMSQRSRHVFDRRILQQLLEAGIETSIATAISVAFRKEVFPQKEKENTNEAEDQTSKADDKLETNQVVLFGKPEIQFLCEQALEVARKVDSINTAKKAVEDLFKPKDFQKNLEAMKLHAGLEAALFGRMITSDLYSNIDAAIHVAHAFTVHAEESENDYFTVVDDLKSQSAGGDKGAGGIFDMELTCGLYYGYVVVDVGTLLKNLGGDQHLATQVIQHLLHLIAKISPGAKLGSTAPYSWADLVLVETTDRQPRTLANAFRDPIPLKRNGGTLACAVERLNQYLTNLDGCYGNRENRRFASPDNGLVISNGAERLSFDHLAEWAAKAIAILQASSIPGC